MRDYKLIPAVLALALAACSVREPPPAAPPADETTAAVERTSPADPRERIVRSEEEWRKALTPEQYRVLREKGTERAFTGKYWDTKTPGSYVCAGCGQELFASDAKYDSGCGWPSFTAPASGAAVDEAPDTSHGMVRTEILCSRCGGHLGHVFPDGPGPTGLRYCVNSASIELLEEGE